MSIYPNNSLTFAEQTALQGPGHGSMWGGCCIHNEKRVYSTLFLGLMKLRNFLIGVKSEMEVDALCGYDTTVNADT